MLKIFIVITIMLMPSLSYGQDPKQLLAELNKLYKTIKVDLDGKNVAQKITLLETLSNEYKANPYAMKLIPQLLAEQYSYAGLHLKAISTTPRHMMGNIEDIAGYKAVNAIQEISTMASNRQIVMINEAHHNPQHRVTTYDLLSKLWQQGFRYLAVEALAEDFSIHLETTHLTKPLGAYFQEPIYGQLILKAKELGFKLIAYDYSRVKSKDEREQKAASIIIDKVFKKDPQAKVIIHCGYSHINEDNWLASFLQRQLNTDPLTINQTDRVEEVDMVKEHPTYKAAVAKWRRDIPFVLKNDSGEYWSARPSIYDVSLFWPRSTYKNGRPYWASLGRKSVKAPIEKCSGKFPCTAIVRETASLNEQPSDRYIFLNSQQQGTLFLRTPNSQISVITNDE